MKPQSSIPFITTEQMREVDRVMIEDYGIILLQMMENAGRNLARFAMNRFKTTSTIIILAGTGGNGGGALVSARYLANWGYNVIVVTTKPVQKFTGVPRHQLDIVNKLGIKVCTRLQNEYEAELIIDGLIGYSMSGPPKGPVAEMINWANNYKCPVLSLDLPSGIDGDRGYTGHLTIKAAATMTLALPKIGLQQKEAKPFVGELYLADIGVPPQIYTGMNIDFGEYNYFKEKGTIRVW